MIIITTFSLVLVFLICADLSVKNKLDTDPHYVKTNVLKEAVASLEGVDIDIYIDSLDRTLNAYTGGIFSRFMVITLPLFRDAETKTLEAVITHELGHVVRRHPLHRMIATTAIVTSTLLFAFYYPFPALAILFLYFTFEHKLKKIIDRTINNLFLYQEYEADLYACERGYMKELLLYLGDSLESAQHRRRVANIVNNADKSL